MSRSEPAGISACAATPSAICSAPRRLRQRCSTSTRRVRGGERDGQFHCRAGLPPRPVRGSLIRRTGDHATDIQLQLPEDARQDAERWTTTYRRGGNDVTPAFHVHLRPLLGRGLTPSACVCAPGERMGPGQWARPAEQRGRRRPAYADGARPSPGSGQLAPGGVSKSLTATLKSRGRRPPEAQAAHQLEHLGVVAQDQAG